MNSRWITVVAAALEAPDGRWLMHRRPPGKHHAGLWEFPGGKVEADEMPHESLVRELAEELGISCRAADFVPAGFASGAGQEDGPGIVILLYRLRLWQGEPEALEGGAVGWFTAREVDCLAKPPLDHALAAQLFSKTAKAG